jgi:hypothetical protein
VTRPIEVRRLNAADAEPMHSIVAMRPPPNGAVSRFRGFPNACGLWPIRRSVQFEFDLAASGGEEN